MIKITRLNDSILVINADMIQFLEATPDTIITLTDGRKVVAKEPVEEIIEKVIEYKHRFLVSGPQVLTRET